MHDHESTEDCNAWCPELVHQERIAAAEAEPVLSAAREILEHSQFPSSLDTARATQRLLNAISVFDNGD